MSSPSPKADSPQAAPAESPPTAITERNRYSWLALLILGYIGIYLCRKNFSVAIPLLQDYFNASRAEIGLIASYSTIAYAAGKFLFGPVVDRIGGRRGFLWSLFLVAIMGIAGGFAPSLTLLTVFYSLNRFAGAAGWPAMVKMTPSWFDRRRLPFAIALLSLSFVIGGAFSTFFGGLVASWSGNNWRAVMAVPSIVLLAFLALNAWLLPRDRKAPASVKKVASFSWADLYKLFGVRQFWIVCALSFTLTLLREAFNTWTVDFIKTEGGAEVSHRAAAMLSTPFDIMGMLGILAVGWFYGRIQNTARKWLLFGMLAALALLLYNLQSIFRVGLAAITIALGLVGFLTYGPYSLLAGTLSVEVQGQKSAGTVSGLVDGVGYIAAILAGAQFGKMVDLGGYHIAFKSLGLLAISASVLCLFLYPSSRRGATEQSVPT